MGHGHLGFVTTLFHVDPAFELGLDRLRLELWFRLNFDRIFLAFCIFSSRLDAMKPPSLADVGDSGQSAVDGLDQRGGGCRRRGGGGVCRDDGLAAGDGTGKGVV